MHHPISEMIRKETGGRRAHVDSKRAAGALAANSWSQLACQLSSNAAHILTSDCTPAYG